MKAPMLLGSTSVEGTLKPRLELLQRDMGLPADALPGIIARFDMWLLHYQISCLRLDFP